jgi:hypothetical protein
MEYQRKKSISQEAPFPLSATASTRSSGPGASSGTSGYRMRPHIAAGPGLVKPPWIMRHSIADRYPSTQPSGSGTAGPSGGAAGAGSRGATGPASVRMTRHAVARATARPPELAVASSSSTLRPGRASRAVTVISPTGIAPRISQVNRAIIISSLGWQRSMARPSSALGGPACCARGSQGPVVCTVACHRSSPSGT